MWATLHAPGTNVVFRIPSKFLNHDNAWLITKLSACPGTLMTKSVNDIKHVRVRRRQATSKMTAPAAVKCINSMREKKMKMKNKALAANSRQPVLVTGHLRLFFLEHVLKKKKIMYRHRAAQLLECGYGYDSSGGATPVSNS